MRTRSTHLLVLSLGGIAGALCGCTTQQTYDSPEKAADAFVRALRDRDRAELERVLGPDGEDVLYSGDDVGDENTFDAFVEAYDAKHTLVRDEDGTTKLVVGEKDWPLPFPIVAAEKEGTWRFDAEAGKEEILDRRIGGNELSAIEVCRAIVDAQREYAMIDHDGDGFREYARKFRSEPGKHDGLYWETAEGEPTSPLGPLVAEARGEGYTPDRASSDEPSAYHGYRFRILTAQGPAARGGEQSYLVRDKLIGGFGVVAYPVDYASSGIMTFITNQDGEVYERDLGPDTMQHAREMSAFDPGPGWEKVEATGN